VKPGGLIKWLPVFMRKAKSLKGTCNPAWHPLATPNDTSPSRNLSTLRTDISFNTSIKGEIRLPATPVPEHDKKYRHPPYKPLEICLIKTTTQSDSYDSIIMEHGTSFIMHILTFTTNKPNVFI
jgi:hypothetical protein